MQTLRGSRFRLTVTDIDPSSTPVMVDGMRVLSTSWVLLDLVPGPLRTLSPVGRTGLPGIDTPAPDELRVPAALFATKTARPSPDGSTHPPGQDVGDGIGVMFGISVEVTSVLSTAPRSVTASGRGSRPSRRSPSSWPRRNRARPGIDSELGRETSKSMRGTPDPSSFRSVRPPRSTVGLFATRPDSSGPEPTPPVTSWRDSQHAPGRGCSRT